MTAKEHGRLLGIFFLIQAALAIFGGIITIFIYGGVGTVMLLNSRREEDYFVGAIFIVMTVVMTIFMLVFAGLYLFGGWKLFKGQAHSKVLLIIISVISLLGFPLGTVLGVYGLWFAFGNEGKEYYDGVTRGNSEIQPPPPPNSWS